MRTKKAKKPIKLIEPNILFVPSPDDFAVIVHVPAQIVSEANKREHWRVAYERKRRQERAWVLAIRGSTAIGKMSAPHLVTLTRLGPRLLDDDNLQGGFKKLRDCVAASLGLDDGPKSPITWAYGQQKSKAYGAIVRIEPMAKGTT